MDDLLGIVRKDRQKGYREMGKAIVARAREYCPISPKQGQLNALRKTNRHVHRKARATSRANPGGLYRSITCEATDDYVDVFVPLDSEAGAYAYRIEMEKGLTWQKRGPGTVAKGAQADAKFIERAIDDLKNEGVFEKIWDSV